MAPWQRSNREVQSMLNVPLIEQFQMISREQRGGAVEVTLGERRIRFGFEGGELSLLDMGEEKELAMARKLLDYHKIGPEIHRHAVAMARATGGSIVDTLRRQQLVSDGEFDQVAQSMIEDLLSTVFGIGSLPMVYRPQEDLATFDLEKRAVRLKIDIPTLLDSVQSRVSEEEAVLAELGGWSSPVALDEGGDADQLDDFERHILTQVDGKKTVEQIAIAFRDSNFNIGRMLVGMMRKGFIRRGSMSGVRPASAPAVLVQPGAGAAVAPAGDDGQAPQPRRTSDFEVYRPVEEPASNAGFRMVLGTVLAVLVAIGLFVWLAGRNQGEVIDRLGQIEQDILGSHWAQAQASLQQARAATGNDLAMVRRVEALEKRLASGLDEEASKIEALIKDQQFPQAGERLSAMPLDHPRTDELRQLRQQGMLDFEAASSRLSRQALERVERGDIPGAFALVQKARPGEAEAALKAIDRWRLTTIEQARRGSISLGERQALVNLVQSAKPSPYQAEQLQMLQEELNRGQNRRKEQIIALAKRVERGAWEEAQAEVDKEHLLDQAPGSDLLAEVTALVKRIAEVRKDLDSIPTACNDALAAASDPQSVARARKRLGEAIVTYPEASNLAQLKALDAVLSQMEPLVGRGSTADEATALGGLIADQPEGTDLVKSVRSRIAALRTAALEAEGALESARAIGREGKWDECIAALVRIGAQPEWKRTPTGLTIADEIIQAKARKQRIEEMTKEFHAKLDAGDISGAYELSRQMGLRYLPLLVESMPPGATVQRDGKDIGKTPLVIEISAGDRLDLTLLLQAPGCQPLELKGADAVGGWRLSGALRRSPVASAKVQTTLTSAPAGADGRLWVAGSAGVVAVDAQGRVSTFPYADTAAAAPVEPVYAPAVGFDDGVFVATRDRFVLRIANQKSERLPLLAATDLPLLSYRSSVILDRRFLIGAGLDGSVVASDPSGRSGGWKTASGIPFTGTLAIVGDAVLGVRRNGDVIAVQVDRGEILASKTIGEPVLSVWSTSTGLAGITATSGFTWDGTTVVKSALPRSNAVAGAPGMIVTKERQVLVLEGQDWKPIGQLPGELTASPIMWRGHPVLVSNKTVYVLGVGGFQVDSASPFLAPAVVGDHLALATSGGEITFFAP